MPSREEIVMERGSSKHGPHVDDQMKHEEQGLIQGNRIPHAEEWRDTEPLPDDTDTPDISDALRMETPPEAAGSGPEDSAETS
jgi:hypothetical protein